jgi:predicted lipoprotein
MSAPIQAATRKQTALQTTKPVNPSKLLNVSDLGIHRTARILRRIWALGALGYLQRQKGSGAEFQAHPAPPWSLKCSWKNNNTWAFFVRRTHYSLLFCGVHATY